MSEPTDRQIRSTFSHADMIENATKWMHENYGIVRDLPMESRDRYHEKLGLLVDFIGDTFPRII